MLKQQDTYDVAVVGGGLAGLTLALQAQQQTPAARIVVLEKRSHPVPEAAFKVGESTVEIGAHYFAQVLGLEEHIRTEQLPKLGLRFFFRHGDNSRIERRLELGGTSYPTTPSYQLDRGRFENFLGQQCLDRGIEFVDQACVQQMRLAPGKKFHALTYQRHDKPRSIQARWLIDASGRAGVLKRQLGLAKPSSHKANAVWFRVGQRIKIDEWSSDQHWQQGYGGEIARWYSTNHLMGEGYWVWLIPLASGSTSVGIVADERIHPLSTFNSLDKSLVWLDKHEPQCAAKLRDHEDKIQDFLAVKHYAMECRQVFSRARWALTGEAGFFLDPFYSPGSDFIGIANTFISDMIGRDLAGKPVLFRAFLYDKIFKSFYHGTAAVYQDQYPIFGNHQVMPVKLLWDYMVYWSVTGFIMLHGRACDALMYPKNMFKLTRLRKMNEYMQKFFQSWHAARPAQEVSGKINVSHVPMIWDTNKALSETLDDRAFNRQFGRNVEQLETLFWEILDHADIPCDLRPPVKRRQLPHASPNSFGEIFRVTSPAGAASGDETSQAVAATPTAASDP